MRKQYSSFGEFYPHYLAEHEDAACRRLHFAGSVLVLGTVGAAIVTRDWRWFLASPLVGYGFAWAGPFPVRAQPSRHVSPPLYSLAGAWVTFKGMLIGRLRF